MFSQEVKVTKWESGVLISLACGLDRISWYLGSGHVGVLLGAVAFVGHK